MILFQITIQEGADGVQVHAETPPCNATPAEVKTALAVMDAIEKTTGEANGYKVLNNWSGKNRKMLERFLRAN